MGKLSNLTSALINHTVDGLSKVDVNVVNERLCKCNACEFRDKETCTHPECGCYLDTKVWFKSEKCPIGLW